MGRRIVVMKLVCLLSQRRLTADWLAPQECECSQTHSKVSSDRLPSYIKVLEIFKMARCLLDRPCRDCILSDNCCKSLPLTCLTFKTELTDHSSLSRCLLVRSVLYELHAAIMQILWQWNGLLYVTCAQYSSYWSCPIDSDKISLILLFETGWHFTNVW